MPLQIHERLTAKISLRFGAPAAPFTFLNISWYEIPARRISSWCWVRMVRHFFVDFIFDGDLFHHARSATFRITGSTSFFLDCDLLVFDEFLDQLRGHMAHIIAVSAASLGCSFKG